MCVAAWFSWVGVKRGRWLFAVMSVCPGLAGLVGLAGESGKLWKWVQLCPPSCQVVCDRQVGFVFMINLPRGMAGGMVSERAFSSAGMGELWGGSEITSRCCCCLLFAALGNSVPRSTGSSCSLGVCTLCVHLCSTCVDAFTIGTCKIEMHINYSN